MAKAVPEICVDHYVLWIVRPIQVDVGPVKLKEQFQPETYSSGVLHDIQFLGNPAKKRRPGREEEEILHPSVHLLPYTLGEPHRGPRNRVIIRNQFTGPDGDSWSIGESRFLLVPARKTHAPDPPPTTPPLPRVDHFVCYEADGPLVNEFSSPVDQFDATDINVMQPRFLGVPADKRGEGILHPDVHLAIYDVQQGIEHEVVVNTADQFGRRQLKTKNSQFFAVPSFKEWQPPK